MRIFVGTIVFDTQTVGFPLDGIDAIASGSFNGVIVEKGPLTHRQRPSEQGSDGLYH